MAQHALAFIASAWGVVMGLAPVLQIRRMLREHSSRDISLGYFAVLLAGFGLWIGYGATAGNLALVIPNSVALLTAAALVIIALRLRRHERRGLPRPGQARSRGAARGRRSG